MKLFGVIILFMSSLGTANALVRIGTPLFDEPFIINDGGTAVTGYDVELMQTICTRLTWDCEFISMESSKLFSELEANEVDFVMGGQIITSAIRAKYIASTPYLISKGSFVTLKNSQIKLKELSGKRIGAIRDRPYYDYLRTVPQLTAVPYEKVQDLASDLRNNKINAAFVNYYSAHYMANQYPDLIQVIDTDVMVGEGFGIVALPSKQAEIQQINQVLLQFESDGTFVKLYNYYFQFFIKS